MSSENTVQARIVVRGEVASVNGPSEGVWWELGFLGDKGVLPLRSRREDDLYPTLAMSLEEAFEWADEQVNQVFNQKPRWYPLDNSGLLWAANLLFDTQSTPN